MKFVHATIFCLSLGLLAWPPAYAGWEEGVAAFTSKNYDTAVKELKKVVRRNPEDVYGHYLLGQAYAKEGRKEESLNHLRKAYDLNPNDAGIGLALADAYSAKDKHRDAEIVAKQALQRVWRQLGYVYEKQKKYQKSIDAYKKAGDTEGVNRAKRAKRRK